MAGSMIALGMRTMSSAASDSVIEWAMVKAVTIFTTGHSRRAHHGRLQIERDDLAPVRHQIQRVSVRNLQPKNGAQSRLSIGGADDADLVRGERE